MRHRSSSSIKQQTPHRCERRARKRLLCSDLVQISWIGSNDSRHSEIVILENLSTDGAGLFTGVPLPEGIAVQLAVRDRQLTGIVRQCQFRQNGYIIGLQLTSPVAETLVPEHLLDPSLLALE